MPFMEQKKIKFQRKVQHYITKQKLIDQFRELRTCHIEPGVHDKLGQHRGCWCLGSLHHRVNNRHSIEYNDGFVQDYGISSADALEIPQSCIKPLLWYRQDVVQGQFFKSLSCAMDWSNSLTPGKNLAMTLSNSCHKALIFQFKFHLSVFILSPIIVRRALQSISVLV